MMDELISRMDIMNEMLARMAYNSGSEDLEDLMRTVRGEEAPETED